LKPATALAGLPALVGRLRADFVFARVRRDKINRIKLTPGLLNRILEMMTQNCHKPREGVHVSSIESTQPPPSCARSDMQLAGGMRLSKWSKVVGISKMTAWRWRKEGKLPVIWRYGLPWVTAETIQKFFTDDGSAPRRAPCRQNRTQCGRRVPGPNFIPSLQPAGHGGTVEQGRQERRQMDPPIRMKAETQ
jgi:hypothetical protein